MEFTIRRASLADYDGLCALFTEGDALHAEALPHIFRPAGGPARSQEHINGIVLAPGSVVFVAESGGRVIGMAHVHMRMAADYPIIVPRTYAHVDTLGVAEGYRRRGVGRALMKQAEQWALSHGAAEIELNVWEFNENAIEFYKNLGYETSRRTMTRRLTAGEEDPWR
jgi:GNAT superfamily N-acetyltransferase